VVPSSRPGTSGRRPASRRGPHEGTSDADERGQYVHASRHQLVPPRSVYRNPPIRAPSRTHLAVQPTARREVCTNSALAGRRDQRMRPAGSRHDGMRPPGDAEVIRPAADRAVSGAWADGPDPADLTVPGSVPHPVDLTVPVSGPDLTTSGCRSWGGPDPTRLPPPHATRPSQLSSFRSSTATRFHALSPGDR
jgi:hypothetical protein